MGGHGWGQVGTRLCVHACVLFVCVCVCVCVRVRECERKRGGCVFIVDAGPCVCKCVCVCVSVCEHGNLCVRYVRPF
jgi:hypothetical protein